MSKIKALWEAYGKQDPYFAVVTVDRNKAGNMDKANRTEFFTGGSDYVDTIWEIFEGFYPDFNPQRILDFGCGVGRLTIPLALRSPSVIAVDIAQSMLDEARNNCVAQEVDNVAFLETGEYLSSKQSFDLIHSFIVFQHIHPATGMPILRKMISDLDAGGIGALHFPYADSASRSSQFRSLIYQKFPPVYRLRQVLSGRKAARIIPTYVYDINSVIAELHKGGCHDLTVRFSDHGLLGVLLVFRKISLPSL